MQIYSLHNDDTSRTGMEALKEDVGKELEL